MIQFEYLFIQMIFACFYYIDKYVNIYKKMMFLFINKKGNLIEYKSAECF